MPEFAGAKSGGYIGQGASKKAITPSHAPGDAVRDLFRGHAKRFAGSRDRILLCREIRRGLHSVVVNESWTRGNSAAAEWVKAILPERAMIPLNMTNLLAAERPQITRHPRRQSDRAIRQADEFEVWENALCGQLIDWDEIVGKLVEDAELAVVVMPDTAAFEMAPEYMIDDDEGIRMVNPRYSNDRKGIAQWRDDYLAHLAATPPFTVRIIPASDCAPILVRGRGRNRWECRGLVTRQLFEREELITRNLRWKGMENREAIPRGFDQSRQSGQDGMFYLYEAYLLHVDDDGSETPFIARCVGGYETWMDHKSGDEESAVINLADEYGITRLMVHYAYGLHHADDDFDWRGVPILYPLIQTILNVEGLTTAANAHAETNAFTGHVGTVDPALAGTPETFIDSQGDFKKFSKPGADEIKILPGPTQPWSQASVGEDVWRLITQARATLQLNIPDETQTGGKTDASGHAMVVSHELLESAKRQIKEGGRYLYECIAEDIAELACGLARGMWKDMNGYGWNVPAIADIERTVESGGATETATEMIEFSEQWVQNGDYRVTADYPAVGNLTERQQKIEGWKAGAVTWDEMREAFGDTSPETTRLKVARDAFIAGPIGQLMLQIEVAEQRRMTAMAQQLKQELAGELTKMGLPIAALPPELQALAMGQQAQQQAMQSPALPQGPGGPSMPGSPVSVGNPAQNAMNGEISGGMGVGPAQADATAQAAVNPTGGV